MILVVSEYGKEILTDDHGGAVIAEHGNILARKMRSRHWLVYNA